MSRGFDVTYGVGSTDMVKSALTTDTTTCSIAMFVWRNGNGGNGFGRMFDKIAATVDAEYALFDSGASTYTYQRAFTSVPGIWTIVAPATGAFHHFGISYDGGSTANDAVMYLDGISKTVTRSSTPSGTLANNSDAFTIGNREIDNGRNWDGMIAEFAVWNSILTATDFANLAAGALPSSIDPTHLVEYISFHQATSGDTVVSEKGLANPTLTGTAWQSAHPTMSGGGPALTQYRPVSDTAPGNWTTSTGSGTLSSMIDETSPDTADYMQSGLNPIADTCKIRFNYAAPIANTNHTISYTIRGDSGGSLDVGLKASDGTSIKWWVHSPAPGSFTRYDQTLTTTEADNLAAHSTSYMELWITAY